MRHLSSVKLATTEGRREVIFCRPVFKLFLPALAKRGLDISISRMCSFPYNRCNYSNGSKTIISNICGGQTREIKGGKLNKTCSAVAEKPQINPRSGFKKGRDECFSPTFTGHKSKHQNRAEKGKRKKSPRPRNTWGQYTSEGRRKYVVSPFFSYFLRSQSSHALNIFFLVFFFFFGAFFYWKA